MTPCANSFENNSNIHLTLSQAPAHSQPSRHMNDHHFRAHTDVVIWLIKRSKLSDEICEIFL